MIFLSCYEILMRIREVYLSELFPTIENLGETTNDRRWPSKWQTYAVQNTQWFCGIPLMLDNPHSVLFAVFWGSKHWSFQGEAAMMIQLRRVGGLVILKGDSSFSDSRIHKFGIMGLPLGSGIAKTHFLDSWIKNLGASKQVWIEKD